MTTVTKARPSAWGNRDFRRLWAGATASGFGAEIAEIALPLLALLTLSANASQLSVLRVAQFLPFLVATLPLGLVVDRRAPHRLRYMVAADLGRFVLMASIPVVVWLGAASMELLYVVVFAAGVLTVLFEVASFAFLPGLVGASQLVDANGKLQATESASEIGGRGIGGVLVQAVSAPLAVGANAAGYLVSAVFLSRVRATGAAIPDRAPTDDESGTGPTGLTGATGLTGRGSARAEVWHGLRIALTHRYIRPLLGEATTFNVFNEVLVLGIMLWAVRDLHLGAGTIGLVFTAGGVGSFLGAWFGARLTGRFGYGRVLLITLVLGNGAPLGLFASGLVGGHVVLLLCTVFVVMGVGIGIANTHAVSLRQSAVPEHLTGRTNAAYRLISWGAIPLGAAVGGVVATHLGGHAATLVGAVGVATATLWVAASGVPRLATIHDASAAHASHAGMASAHAGERSRP